MAPAVPAEAAGTLCSIAYYCAVLLTLERHSCNAVPSQVNNLQKRLTEVRRCLDPSLLG